MRMRANPTNQPDNNTHHGFIGAEPPARRTGLPNVLTLTFALKAADNLGLERVALDSQILHGLIISGFFVGSRFVIGSLFVRSGLIGGGLGRRSRPVTSACSVSRN